MKQDEIRKMNDQIIEMNNKLFQALSMHTDIAVRRSVVLENIKLIFSGDLSEKEKVSFVEKLFIIHNQEKRLMEVINPHILRTQSDLKNLLDEGKKKLDKNVRDIGNMMLKALEIIIAKIKLSYTRYDREAKFIEMPNKIRFSEYNFACNAERSADEKLLMLLNPAQVNVITEFLKYNEEQFKKTKVATLGGGGIGAATAVGADGNLPAIVIMTFIGMAIANMARLVLRYEYEVKSAISKQKTTMQEFNYRKPSKK